MREGWRRTTIGEIARVVGGSTPSTRNPDLWNGGIPWITPSEITVQEGRRIATTSRTISAAGLASIGGGLLPAGTVLLTSRATVGAVALAGVPMAVNQGFAAMVTGPDVLAEWLMLWCQLNRPHFEALAGGSTFPEVSKPKVRSVEVDLPPLAQQRRIVDLLQVVDVVRERSGDAAKAASAAVDTYLDEALSLVAMRSSRKMGELAVLGSGPSWKAADEGVTGGPGRLPVVGITSTPAGTRTVDAARRIFVTGLPPSTRTLNTQSLLMIRTNGNRARIGNVYLVPPTAEGHAFSAFQIGIFPRDQKGGRFLFWFLSSPSVQRRISEAASGTTGLGNIAVSWLKELAVPWPSDVERERITRISEALHEIVVPAFELLRRLSVLRSALLTDLLSGDHEIPASYDRFLDGAA